MTRPCSPSTFPKFPDTREYHRRILELEKAAADQLLEVLRISESEYPTGREFAHLQATHVSLAKHVQDLRTRPLPRERYPNGAREGRKIVSVSHKTLTSGLSRLDATISRVAQDIAVLGRGLAVKNHLQMIAYEAVPTSSRPLCARALKERVHQIESELTNVVKRDAEINTPALRLHMQHMQSNLLQHAHEFEKAEEISAEWDSSFALYEDRIRTLSDRKNADIEDLRRLDTHYQPLLRDLSEKAATAKAPVSEKVMLMRRAEHTRHLLRDKIAAAKKRLEELTPKCRADHTRHLSRDKIASAKRRQEELTSKCIEEDPSLVTEKRKESLKTIRLKARYALVAMPLETSTAELASRLAELKEECAFKYRRKRELLENGYERLHFLHLEVIDQTRKELEDLPLKTRREIAELDEAEQRKATDELIRHKNEYERLTNMHKESHMQAQTEIQMLEEQHAKSAPEIQSRYFAAETSLAAFEARRKAIWERLHSFITPVVRTPSPATITFSSKPSSRPHTSPITLSPSVQCIRFKSRLRTA